MRGTPDAFGQAEAPMDGVLHGFAGRPFTGTYPFVDLTVKLLDKQGYGWPGRLGGMNGDACPIPVAAEAACLVHGKIEALYAEERR